MKTFKNIIGWIAIFLIFTVIFIGNFIWNYFENNIPNQLLPYVILFYSAIIILFFSVMNIACNLSFNNKKTLKLKYDIYKQIYILDKDNKLHDFEFYCVKNNNEKLLKDLAPNLSSKEYKNVENLLKNEKFEELEKYSDELKINRKRHVIKAIKSYNFPNHYNYFYDYHNKTLLNKKNSIFSFIGSFISFVLAILPFFINGLSALPLHIYLEFSVPLIIIACEFPSIYKSNLKEIVKNYENDLNEIIKDIETFNKQ